MKTKMEILDRRGFLKRSAQSTAALAALAGLSFRARADGADGAVKRSRISYFCNGRIYVNRIGQSDGNPILSPPVPGQQDFNPTWTRDGMNSPIWNRRNEKGGGFHIMQGKVGGKPGEETALTDDSMHTWGHSCLVDGRIFVTSWHPKQGRGAFLLTCRDGRTGKGQLYVYKLEDGSTARVSTNDKADYRYPHGEAAPC